MGSRLTIREAEEFIASVPPGNTRDPVTRGNLWEERAMITRAIRFVAVAAVPAAVVIAVAALTTWWVLLALVPLVMMVGCMAMMAAMPSMDALGPRGWGGGRMGFDGWLGGRRETPAEILARRFAEGAISVEDYRERREVIAGDRRWRGAAGEEDVVGGRESAETPPAESFRR